VTKERDIQAWGIFHQQLSVNFMSMAFIESFGGHHCSDIGQKRLRGRKPVYLAINTIALETTSLELISVFPNQLGA